jgi:hypothetical protein
VWDTRTATVDKAASSPGGIALQIVFAALLVLIAFFGFSRKLVWTWLSITAMLPVALPLFGTFAWSKFYSFLSVPLLSAILLAAVAAGAWIAMLTGRSRLLWPTVIVAVFFSTFAIVGQIQFHRDVRLAAEKLSPECLDAGPFLNSLSSGFGDMRFSLHAGAHKSDETFGWSFAKRDFYKLPKSVDRSVRSGKSAWFTSPYPSCRP